MFLSQFEPNKEACTLIYYATHVIIEYTAFLYQINQTAGYLSIVCLSYSTKNDIIIDIIHDMNTQDDCLTCQMHI